MMERQTIYAAVRRDRNGEFVDLTTVSFHRAGAVQAAGHTASPRWREQNPVERIGRFDLVELER